MGRPVISANLCVSQGAFETDIANGRSFLYKKNIVLKEFFISQQNSTSL